jgi:hypothetical protein
MRTTSVALAVAFLCRPLAAQAFDPDRAVAAVRTLLKGSETMLRADASGVDGVDGEWAAFIVRSADGSYDFISWPNTGERYAATWHGPIPSGTLAIAHTHPVTMPQPSRNDVKIAMRLNLPFVIISRTHVFVVDSTGKTRVLASDGWQQRDTGGAQTAAASPLR